MSSVSNPEISVIVAVKNEEENVPLLAAEIVAALDRADLNWECLWINDGSTDTTLEQINKLAAANPRHRLVDLEKNFGQSAAIAIGFRAGKADVLATLDGDGQNDPADLPRLYARLREGGHAMVNGIRAKRQDDIIRKVCSKIANGFRNILTGESVTDVGCAIRVFKKEAVLNIPVWKGMHRFIPTLVKMQGYTIDEIPVNHRSRERGVTKYGINNRLWVGLVDTFAVCWMKRRLVFPKAKV